MAEKSRSIQNQSASSSLWAKTPGPAPRDGRNSYPQHHLNHHHYLLRLLTSHFGNARFQLSALPHSEILEVLRSAFYRYSGEWVLAGGTLRVFGAISLGKLGRSSLKIVVRNARGHKWTYLLLCVSHALQVLVGLDDSEFGCLASSHSS